MKTIDVPVTTKKTMYACDLCPYTSEYSDSVRRHEREDHQTSEHLSFDLFSNGHPVEFWKFASEDQHALAMKGRWAPNAKWSGPGWYYWREKGDRYVDYGTIKDIYDHFNEEARSALENIETMEYRLKISPAHRKYVPAELFRKAQKLIKALEDKGILRANITEDQDVDDLLEVLDTNIGEEE